jgi:leader peptidase (prepilin peptidase)/N-methyltransferase
METLIIILFGLAWGSFLNVIIYRLPYGLNIVHPASSCPKCKTRIKVKDNIPVLSYLLLRGKCRYCRTPISLRYPFVEILTPLIFLLLYSQYSFSTHFFASCLFATAMILLAFIDFNHQILPDEITLPGLLLALGYALFRPDLTLRQSLIGAVCGAGFLLFIYGAYYLIRKKEGLGLGDVTMMLLIGAYLGLGGTILTLIAASFAGAAIGIIIILFKKKDMQFALPFGTFLAPAAFFSLVWGERILNWYLSLFRKF